MRAKQEAPYRVWLLARAMDTTGKGVVGIRDLGAFCETEHVCTREALARVIRSGSGSYWHAGSGGLCYVSLFKLCDALETRPGRPIWLDADVLRNTRRFRAALLQSWIGSGRTISRATMAKLSGKCDSTVGDYLRRKPTRTRAVVLDNALTIANLWQSVRPVKDYEALRAEDKRWFITVIGHKPTLCQRMPNTYLAMFASAAVGQARKYRGPSYSMGAGRKRLYFENGADAARAFQRGATDVYYKTTRNDVELGNGQMCRVWGRWQNVPDAGIARC